MRKERKYAKKTGLFLQKVFPWKGDNGRTIILKTATLVFLIVFLVSAYILFRDFIYRPMQSDHDVQELKDLWEYAPSSSQTESVAAESDTQSATETEEIKETEETEKIEENSRMQVDFSAMQTQNPDIIGWIQIPNTVVDYPVLQSSENDSQYYLYRNYRHVYTHYGSIFLDSAFSFEDEISRNHVLYGHNMNDGRMFAEILKYADLTYYMEHPILHFDTVQQQGDWKIISVFKTNTLSSQGELFQYNQTKFSSEAEYLNFVYQMRIRSIIDTGVDFSAQDDILTLSTCSYEFEDFRTVLVARRVREGEEKNVPQAAYNSAVVYPSCWYSRYGGSMPNWPNTVEEAVAQGSVFWLKEE